MYGAASRSSRRCASHDSNASATATVSKMTLVRTIARMSVRRVDSECDRSTRPGRHHAPPDVVVGEQSRGIDARLCLPVNGLVVGRFEAVGFEAEATGDE